MVRTSSLLVSLIGVLLLLLLLVVLLVALIGDRLFSLCCAFISCLLRSAPRALISRGALRRSEFNYTYSSLIFISFCFVVLLCSLSESLFSTASTFSSKLRGR